MIALVDLPIGERIRAVSTTAILLLVISAVAGTMVSLLIPDFDRGISRVLISGPPLQSATGGLNIIEDGGPASVINDFNFGIRLGLLGLLAIGIPLGICARLLTSNRLSSHVNDQWGTVLHLGFVLQLLSIARAVGLLLLYAMDGLDKYRTLPLFTLLLVGDLVIGGIAVPSWRSLQARRAGPLLGDRVTRSNKKVIASCIYCSNLPDGQEHWLNRSLGTFAGNTLLTGRICTPCNVRFGGSIDLELARTAHIGVTRHVLGIEGRSSHERKNPFEYKASQTEPPVQVFRVSDEGLKPVLEDAFTRNSDGTLISTRARLLVIATADGEHELRFPRGWGEHQLRSAAEARGLLGGRPVSAHVAPPETVDEFLATSKAVIRAVFGPFEIDLYHSRLDGPVGPVEPTVLRFNLSPAFFRGVAKVAFHYFLWACPQIGGDEREFSDLKAYIRDGVGAPPEFLHMSDSLVERIPANDGAGKDAHVFASAALGVDLVVQVHFCSQPVGPAFPTFVVKLGRRPEVLPTDWRSAHVAAYTNDIVGHDGVLRELAFEMRSPSEAERSNG